MLVQSQQFEKFTGWSQFSVQDEDATLDFDAAVWAGTSVNDMIDVTPGMLHIGTFRVATLPIIVEIHDREPDESLARWDHVTEAAIDIPSGTLVIFAADYWPEAPRMTIEPGLYRARIYYGGFDTVSENKDEGEDHYKVALWRGEHVPSRVVKRRAEKYLLGS